MVDELSCSVKCKLVKTGDQTNILGLFAPVFCCCISANFPTLKVASLKPEKKKILIFFLFLRPQFSSKMT